MTETLFSSDLLPETWTVLKNTYVVRLVEGKSLVPGKDLKIPVPSPGLPVLQPPEGVTLRSRPRGLVKGRQALSWLSVAVAIAVAVAVTVAMAEGCSDPSGMTL